MNKIRWAVAWSLYWLGDLASKIMELHDGYEDGVEKYDLCTEEWIDLWYPIYNTLMNWSGDLQGDRDGPWEAWTAESFEREDNGSEV